MKILHTGDWHIGKLVHGIHMTDDQKYILKQLKALIKSKKPDVLIIAGDLYDRSVPPVEAVELLDSVLTDIIMKQKTKVIAITGNHDSPDRVGFASKMLSENGLFIRSSFEGEISPIIIEDEFGAINFYPIPYCEPSIVREALGDDTIKNHDMAMKAIIENIEKDIDYSSRNICIAHAFMLGTLLSSDSVRPLSIGGSEYVNVQYFEKFDYVALGHLHRPQRVGSDNIRYAGSLLKYSFSEARQKKSVTLIDMDGDGNIEIEQIQLQPIRDMRVIKGNLNNLMDKDIYSLANTDDYIQAIITDKGELIDPLSTLRSVYPNILKLEREQFERQAGNSQTSASPDFINKNPLELFEEFYENISTEVFTDEKKRIVAQVIDDISKKGRIS